MGPSAILSVLVSADTQQASERLSKYDRQLREVQGAARHGIETRLGATFDPKAFVDYEARLSQAARRAKDRAAFKAELGANFSSAGFNAYERSVEKARRETERLAATQEAAQSRMRRAASSFFQSGSSGEQRSFVRGTVRGTVGRGAGFLGGGLVGGLAGFASADAIKSSIEGTTQLVKQAQILAHYTGMSQQSAMEFQAVASALGVSSKSLGVGFRTLSTAVNTALTTPTKASTRAFRELGLSQAEVKAHANDLGGMLGLVSDRLNKLAPGAERTALAAKLLGRNWQQLAPLLMQGSKGMEEQLKQAKALGVTLGGDPLKNIAKLHEAEINLKLAQEGLSVQFTEHVAPALIKVTMGAIKLAGEIRQDLAPVFKTLSPILKDTGHWLAAHKTIIEGLVGAFIALKVVKTVGGWFLGLYNDAKKVVEFGSTIIGTFTRQGAAASEQAVQVNELAAAYERLALAQKETGGVAPMLGGAGPAVAREGAVAAEGAGAGLAARGALGLAGKVFLPLAAGMGLLNVFTGKGGSATGRFLSGATMGLIPASAFSTPSNASQRQQGRQRGQFSFGNFAASQQGTAAGQRVLTGQGVEQYTRRLQQLNKQIDDNAVHKVYDSVHHEWVQIAGDQKVVLDRQAQLNTLTKNFAKEQAGATPVIEANIRALMGGSKFQSAGSVFKAITPELDKLTGKFQNAGAMSALAYARSLERNGRLPRGATDKLIRDLESKFPSFARYLGREGVTGMKSLGDALDVRHLRGKAAALINSFRRTFGWLPTYAATAGRSTEQKMRSAMVALRGIIATGSAAQRAAATPALKKLVADYQAYMGEIKVSTADAEKSARGWIQRLGGDWKSLGSVIETVVDKQILPSINAAFGGINSLLGVAKRLPQTAETQQRLQHAARAAALGVHPTAATHSAAPHHVAAPGWNVPHPHHAAARARQYIVPGGTTLETVTPAVYRQQVLHHRLWLLQHPHSTSSAALSAATRAAARSAARSASRAAPGTSNATSALGNAPSQSIAAQIQMAALANRLQIAQNDQNIPAQQKALNAELRLEKAWMGEDKRRLARIVKMLKARDLSRSKRSQLQQARLSVLQEIGNVAGQMSSTMSSLSGLTDSTGSGAFDLAPTGASVQLPTVYDVRHAMGRGTRHQAIHKGMSPHTNHTSHNEITINVEVKDERAVPKVTDAIDRALGSNIHAHMRRAGMRGT